MKLFKRILCLCFAAALLLSALSVPTSAAEAGFSWKPYDKGYVSFVIDDAYPATEEYIKMFNSYNMPMCVAIPAYKIVDSEGENPFQVKTWLTNIQNHGGEILAHNYTHTYFTPETPASVVEEQFSKARKVWDASEYNVNGIIACNEAANGNPVKDYTVIGELASKYGYKYSNRYGVGEQYHGIDRIWLSETTLTKAKRSIEDAVANKKWVVFAGHGSHDIKSKVLEELLKFISETEGAECVTLKYMFETYGNYSTPQDFGPTYYTVDFTDESGKVINSQVVVKGTAAKAPSGYNWDTDVSNVTTNLTVKPASASADAPSGNTDTQKPNNNNTGGNTDKNDDTVIIDPEINLDPNSAPNHTPFIIIGAVVGVIIIATVIVLIIVLKKKKKA